MKKTANPMLNTPHTEDALRCKSQHDRRPRQRATVIQTLVWLLALAGSLGLCHFAARIVPRPVDLSLLYAGAITAFAAGLCTSLLKRRSVGKPIRSFFIQGISPGVLRLLTLCAILSTVVFLDERVGAHVGLGMVCGSLAGMIADVVLLAGVNCSASPTTE